MNTKLIMKFLELLILVPAPSYRSATKSKNESWSNKICVIE